MDPDTVGENAVEALGAEAGDPADDEESSARPAPEERTGRGKTTT